MKTIYISSEDHARLNKTVNELRSGGGKTFGSLEKLQQELNRAVVLDAGAIPPGVVTINSKVRMRDLDTGETEEWILSMPEHANPDQQRISILAPIGTAILGFSEGDEIEWETPGGIRKLKLEHVEAGTHPETGPPNPAVELYRVRTG